MSFLLQLLLISQLALVHMYKILPYTVLVDTHTVHYLQCWAVLFHFSRGFLKKPRMSELTWRAALFPPVGNVLRDDEGGALAAGEASAGDEGGTSAVPMPVSAPPQVTGTLALHLITLVFCEDCFLRIFTATASFC